MTAGVFDFDFLHKRVNEIGIKPIYNTAEHEAKEAAEIAAKRPNIGSCSWCEKAKSACDGSCCGC